MSKFKYIFSVLALLLIACDSDDDGFYNTVYVQASGLMSIENPASSYSVGDVIMVSANIPRLLDEPGNPQPLDVMQTTGADSFQFSFILEKQNTAGEWELVNLVDNYVAGTDGSANIGYYVQGFAEYDAIADSYLYDGGIELDQSGTYRLNFSNNTDFYDKVYFVSDSPGNNIVVNIFSSAADLDASGTFQFTVN